MGFKKASLIAFIGLATLSLAACRKEAGQAHQSAKVGIIQYAEHSALDAAREGFIEVLAEGGFKEGKTLTVTT